VHNTTVADDVRRHGVHLCRRETGVERHDVCAIIRLQRAGRERKRRRGGLMSLSRTRHTGCA
jgi:hypothetical protein